MSSEFSSCVLVALRYHVRTWPTVQWYMQRFRADGLVDGPHEGKYTHYAVVPDVSRFVLPAAADQPAAATAG